MHYHRGLLFWGLALITGGAVALAAQQGYIDHSKLVDAWKLWPLILIVIGISILASGTPFAIVGTIVAALVVGAAGGALIAVGPGIATCGGPEPTDLATEHGEFGKVAQVSLDFNCGTLNLVTTDDHQWTVASGRQGGGVAKVSVGAEGDFLGVRSGDNNQWWLGGRQRWNVMLPKATTYDLSLTPNAADTTIDLGGGRFTVVSLHPNAGSVTLDMTDAQVDNLGLSLNAGSAIVLIGPGSPMDASMSVNAGSIEVCTRDGVALQVTSDPNITFSTNLDASGLDKAGNSWSTPDYVASTDKVHIQLEGNAGSFTLNPEGGCS
jgi:hypothetical protein